MSDYALSVRYRRFRYQAQSDITDHGYRTKCPPMMVSHSVFRKDILKVLHCKKGMEQPLVSLVCRSYIHVYCRKGILVPWRSVHPRIDHAIFRPKLSVHPTNRLLWHSTTVTFRLKVEGLSIHPKLWHSDLVNLDGLSQCDKPSHCNILSQSLWHFVRLFFIQLCCDISSQCNKRSIFPINTPISAHFHVWQLILKGPYMNLMYKAQLCRDIE
jgi:hypothetical protein